MFAVRVLETDSRESVSVTDFILEPLLPIQNLVVDEHDGSRVPSEESRGNDNRRESRQREKCRACDSIDADWLAIDEGEETLQEGQCGRSDATQRRTAK